MANYEVTGYAIVDRRGDEEGRTRIQTVRIEGMDRYEVRIYYLRDNGQLDQSAPTVNPDEETIEHVYEGTRKMDEITRNKEREAQLAAIDDLVQDVGPDRTKQILEGEAEKSGLNRMMDDVKRDAGDEVELDQLGPAGSVAESSAH